MVLDPTCPASQLVLGAEAQHYLTRLELASLSL